MSVALQGNSLPYVRFELRAVEDREKTQKEGRLITKDVAYAIITPAGSRDEIEKIAEEWLSDLRKNSSQQGREYLSEWATGFGKSYEQWKLGNEIPPSGTPIRICLMFKPSEIQAILAANIRTLEDLANANEEALARMGMGSRELKVRAIEAIKTSKNVHSVSEESAALKAENEMLKEQLKEKDKIIGGLEKRLMNKAA